MLLRPPALSGDDSIHEAGRQEPRRWQGEGSIRAKTVSGSGTLRDDDLCELFGGLVCGHRPLQALRLDAHRRRDQGTIEAGVFLTHTLREF